MNTPTNTTHSNPMQTFFWLVKREYWEHRGGFFWAPLIAGGVMIAITLLTMVIAEATAARHGVNINGLNLDTISRNMTSTQIAAFNSGLGAILLGLSVPVMATLFFVVFFYLLGALYDDRRDRSVLFWKSLPISDLDTVLSKVAAAVFVAPLLAVVATVALQLAFLVLLTVYAALHGINPLPLLWNPAPLITMWIKLLCLIPINALWALPTVGWLLLCSAFVRSRPFLWAVVLPVALGAILSFTQLLQQLSLPSSWYFRNVFVRILFGVFPGGWIDAERGGMFNALRNEGDISIALSKFRIADAVLDWQFIANALASLELWLGAAAGVALIAAAIWFRRRRVETSV